MTVEAFGSTRSSGSRTSELHGHPVLSAYLDLDPSRFPTPAARDAQLGSLLADAQHDAAEQDLGGVQRGRRSHPSDAAFGPDDHSRGTRTGDLLLRRGRESSTPFACQARVEPMAVVDTVPVAGAAGRDRRTRRLGCGRREPSQRTAAPWRPRRAGAVRGNPRSAPPPARSGRLVPSALPAGDRGGGGVARTRGRRPPAARPPAPPVRTPRDHRLRRAAARDRAQPSPRPDRRSRRNGQRRPRARLG